MNGLATAQVINNFSTISTDKYNIFFFNQNNTETLISINNQSVSNNTYANINGFDYGMNIQFLNYDSPTIIYLPYVRSLDKNQYININLQNNIGIISNYQSVLTNPYVQINDYILLRNQINPLENQPYRAVGIATSSITVQVDARINNILLSDQNKIFVRAFSFDGFNSYYLGLANSQGYYWINQDICLRLTDCNYGLRLNNEIQNNTINAALFPFTAGPLAGETIAISINGGGLTSGVYKIVNNIRNNILLEPVFPRILHNHQFVKIKLDLGINTNSVWFVNSKYLNNSAQIYGLCKFEFALYDISGIINSPNLWASQVGGANDTIFGLVIYNDIVNNKYLSKSDHFSVGIQVPSWVTDNSLLEGLSLDINYEAEGLF